MLRRPISAIVKFFLHGSFHHRSGLNLLLFSGISTHSTHFTMSSSSLLITKHLSRSRLFSWMLALLIILFLIHFGYYPSLSLSTSTVSLLISNSCNCSIGLFLRTKKLKLENPASLTTVSFRFRRSVIHNIINQLWLADSQTMRDYLHLAVTRRVSCFVSRTTI